ncbi:MAG: hypothetical protein ACK4UJ_01745 [Leptonema sp. (in: bacteria)]
MKEILQKTHNNLNYYISLREKKFITIQDNFLDEEEVKNKILRSGRAFPFIIFVGQEILPQVDEFNTVHLLPVKKGVVELYYRIKNVDKTFRVFINIKFLLDFFPVYVRYVSNLKLEYNILQKEFKNQFDMIVYSSSLSRLDILNLRIILPKAKYVLAGTFEIESGSREDWEHYRITDIAQKVGEDYLTKNPVYAARLFLRKLDFDKMYELPFLFHLTSEELNVIRTFLQIMLENKHNSKELTLNKENISHLKLYYDFIQNLNLKQFSQLGEYIEKNLIQNKKVKKNINLYIKKYRENNKKQLTKDEDILLWELETLLDFQSK